LNLRRGEKGKDERTLKLKDRKEREGP